MGSDRATIDPAAKLLSGDPTTTDRLIPLLDTVSSADARQGILYALSWHGDLRAWELMVRILANPQEDPVVRGQAAEGIAYMFSQVRPGTARFESAAKALLSALKDPSLEVRFGAIFALGESNHLPFVPVLEALVNDQTPVPGWGETIGEKAAAAIESLTWGKT
ncbi:HEAT repeat domain-containing protein [Corallococcus macrosporus]|uniref:HEAT repeat domain-containing protein n=1 Tax=Corallococcus macrosporus TaxID=35 RepID=UPI001EFCF5DC|nr:HEAT repeat domain-containing protein [Corallococcus macrosporus]